MKAESVNKVLEYTIGLFRETGSGKNARKDLIRTFEDERQENAVKVAKRYADKARDIQTKDVSLTVRKIYLFDISEYEVKGRVKVKP